MQSITDLVRAAVPTSFAFKPIASIGILSLLIGCVASPDFAGSGQKTSTGDFPETTARQEVLLNPGDTNLTKIRVLARARPGAANSARKYA